MKIEISRQACCSQDDQVGPLEMDLELDTSATLEHFVTAIHKTKFLQFSSSHNAITGLSGGVPLIRIHDRFFSRGNDEYFFPQETPIFQLIKDGQIEFKFLVMR